MSHLPRIQCVKGYQRIWFLWWQKRSMHCFQGTHLVNAWQGRWSTASLGDSDMIKAIDCRDCQLQVTSSEDHLSAETIDVQTLLVRATEKSSNALHRVWFRDVMRIWRNVEVLDSGLSVKTTVILSPCSLITADWADWAGAKRERARARARASS